MTQFDRDLGRKLRSRRLACGLSMEKLGKQVGRSYQQIQKYEVGSNRISLECLLQISGILDAPMSYFIGGDPASELNVLTDKFIVALDQAVLTAGTANDNLKVTLEDLTALRADILSYRTDDN